MTAFSYVKFNFQQVTRGGSGIKDALKERYEGVTRISGKYTAGVKIFRKIRRDIKIFFKFHF